MRNGAVHSKHHKCKSDLSHACTRDKKKKSGVRVLDTTRLRKMCVRRGEPSSDLEGDVSSGRHREIVLFLDMFGQLNLSLKLQFMIFTSPVAIWESSVSNLIW